ncbi:hypothetical protein K3758_07605 [Sulfitobacter sp. W002]|uniref:hypothetical protein n=1 Tax=Sulfitobacter sp. W002 TaxID=2867024 RepID=UPI0021A7FF9B|nr:hypothetical protein [Sulfitobacter sp. W002]UWR31360.1 hypothetical protein K3758_07605 [Sulfitobacter sp. W002]
MTQVANLPTVPNAMAGPITDKMLEQVICAGTTAQKHSELSDADAALLIITIPQIATELLHRRRAMGVIADMTQLDNVTFITSARDNG